MIDLNKPLWQLTVGEYLELKASLEVKQESVEEMYFSPKEAIGYLKSKNMSVCSSTLYRWRKMNVLTAKKVGGLLTYKKSELDKLFNNQ